MSDTPAKSSPRAEIFKPKSGGEKSAYELHSHGGAAASRAGIPPRAEPNTPKPTPTVATPVKTDTPPPANSNKAQGKALAETVVSSLIDRMAAVAESKGGTLTLQDIRALGVEFQNQTAALSTVFEKTLDQSAKVAKSKNFDLMRRAPFDRIIVKTFSHMFADGTQLKDQKKGLSRRMLPGFFVAVGMMLGEENLNDLQDKCREILDRIRSQKGDTFEWAHLYEDAKARPILVDAMITMAMYFENMGRREAWFMDIINSHLGPVTDPKSPEAGWQLTAPAFYRLLNAMFACLKVELAGAGRNAIGERHGTEKIAKLDGILIVISGREQA